MEPYIENYQYHFCDPLDAKKEMNKLNEEIEMFETEIDAALSEINATTIIKV